MDHPILTRAGKCDRTVLSFCLVKQRHLAPKVLEHLCFSNLFAPFMLGELLSENLSQFYIIGGVGSLYHYGSFSTVNGTIFVGVGSRYHRKGCQYRTVMLSEVE